MTKKDKEYIFQEAFQIANNVCQNKIYDTLKNVEELQRWSSWIHNKYEGVWRTMEMLSERFDDLEKKVEELEKWKKSKTNTKKKSLSKN